MRNAALVFAGFRLEPAERRLTRAGETIDLNRRYLDALLLLARHPDELIAKDRFMAEVWRGVPVTDEALTQCIRALRKALGDDAARPRFIETVPKHGYRFVAAVTQVEVERQRSTSNQVLLFAGSGLAGGGLAGLVGGLGYGLLAASDPPAGTGAISILLVLTCLCLLVGLLGGLGVGGGVGVGRRAGSGRLFPMMAGGALGGLAVGSLGRLIGLDAFSLLIGSKPLAVTGGSEGLLIGALAGAVLWRIVQEPAAPPGRTLATSGLVGGAAGLLVTLGGGTMMAGSLAGLAAAHPQAPLGSLLGTLPPALLLAAGALEGAIFIGALGLALALTMRGKG